VFDIISSRQRKGKDIDGFSMSELIEEFRAMNIEVNRTARVVIDLNLSEDQAKALELKVKEFEEYKKELSYEFIRRFLN
jgi:hypothetical protein